VKAIGLWRRSRERRAAAVDAFVFPDNVRQVFAGRRDLDADGLRTVEAATRQWLRLLARHPRTELSVPSVVVDELWRDLATDTDAYPALCRAAFGRLVEPPGPAARHAHALLRTLRRARDDERCGPQAVPLLFRVDQELAVPGGRRYLTDCGGRGECHELRGVVCLEHLAGPGRSWRGDRDRLGRGSRHGRARGRGGWSRPREAFYTKRHSSGAAGE
jgi:hypothetical protein